MLTERIDNDTLDLMWYASAPLRADRLNSGDVRLYVTGQSRPPMWLDPYCFESENLTVIFDGFLFDLTELMDALGPDKASSSVDPAQLVAQAYCKWGDDFPAKLRGIFCILVTDFERGQTLLARDHTGTQPCFYTIVADRIIVSPSLDGIQLAPGVAAATNVDLLRTHLLGGGLIQKEETFVCGVRRLLPGSILSTAEGEASAKRYWMAEESENFSDWTKAEVQDRFEQVFSTAIARCVHLAPSAILLSGGLDSVSVAAFACVEAERSGTTAPVALSLIFPDPSCNEEDVQRHVAKSLGLKQTCINFDDATEPNGCLAQALEVSSRWPTPVDNIWYGAYQALHRKASKDGCGVILTGGGGDEWLTVTPTYATTLIRQMQIVSLFRFTAAIKRSYRLPLIPLVRNIWWTNGLRPVLVDVIRAVAPRYFARIKRQRLESMQLPSWLTNVTTTKRSMIERASHCQQDSRSGYFHELYTTLDHPLLSMEKEDLYLMGRASGVRILEPYWDPDVVELLFHVRPEVLLAGGRTKAMIRDLMHKRFPQVDFAKQRKVLATVFFQKMISKEGGRSLAKLKGLTALSNMDVINGPAAEELIDRCLREQSPGGRDVNLVWSLLNLETWIRSRSNSKEEPALQRANRPGF